MSKISSIKAAFNELINQASNAKKDIVANWEGLSIARKVTLSVNSTLASILGAMSVASGKGYLGPRKSLAMGVVGTGAAALALRATVLEMSRGTAAKEEKKDEEKKPSELQVRIKKWRQELKKGTEKAVALAKKHPYITGAIGTAVVAATMFGLGKAVFSNPNGKPPAPPKPSSDPNTLILDGELPGDSFVGASAISDLCEAEEVRSFYENSQLSDTRALEEGIGEVLTRDAIEKATAGAACFNPGVQLEAGAFADLDLAPVMETVSAEKILQQQKQEEALAIDSANKNWLQSHASRSHSKPKLNPDSLFAQKRNELAPVQEVMDLEQYLAGTSEDPFLGAAETLQAVEKKQERCNLKASAQTVASALPQNSEALESPTAMEEAFDELQKARQQKNIAHLVDNANVHDLNDSPIPAVSSADADAFVVENERQQQTLVEGHATHDEIVQTLAKQKAIEETRQTIVDSTKGAACFNPEVHLDGDAVAALYDEAVITESGSAEQLEAMLQKDIAHLVDNANVHDLNDSPIPAVSDAAADAFVVANQAQQQTLVEGHAKHDEIVQTLAKQKASEEARQTIVDSTKGAACFNPEVHLDGDAVAALYDEAVITESGSAEQLEAMVQKDIAHLVDNANVRGLNDSPTPAVSSADADAFVAGNQAQQQALEEGAANLDAIVKQQREEDALTIESAHKNWLQSQANRSHSKSKLNPDSLFAQKRNELAQVQEIMDLEQHLAGTSEEPFVGAAETLQAIEKKQERANLKAFAQTVGGALPQNSEALESQTAMEEAFDELQKIRQQKDIAHLVDNANVRGLNDSPTPAVSSADADAFVAGNQAQQQALEEGSATHDAIVQLLAEQKAIEEVRQTIVESTEGAACFNPAVHLEAEKLPVLDIAPATETVAQIRNADEEILTQIQKEQLKEEIAGVVARHDNRTTEGAVVQVEVEPAKAPQALKAVNEVQSSEVQDAIREVVAKPNTPVTETPIASNSSSNKKLDVLLEKREMFAEKDISPEEIEKIVAELPVVGQIEKEQQALEVGNRELDAIEREAPSSKEGIVENQQILHEEAQETPEPQKPVVNPLWNKTSQEAAKVTKEAREDQLLLKFDPEAPDHEVTGKLKSPVQILTVGQK